VLRICRISLPHILTSVATINRIGVVFVVWVCCVFSCYFSFPAPFLSFVHFLTSPIHNLFVNIHDLTITCFHTHCSLRGESAAKLQPTNFWKWCWWLLEHDDVVQEEEFRRRREAMIAQQRQEAQNVLRRLEEMHSSRQQPTNGSVSA